MDNEEPKTGLLLKGRDNTDTDKMVSMQVSAQLTSPAMRVIDP